MSEQDDYQAGREGRLHYDGQMSQAYQQGLAEREGRTKKNAWFAARVGPSLRATVLTDFMATLDYANKWHSKKATALRALMVNLDDPGIPREKRSGLDNSFSYEPNLVRMLAWRTRQGGDHG